ncbi:MAG: PASTA domain-containing protein [Myxococcales bacterium]|nr:PASTA domain-containing protein [Myxococcales bacterium]
MLQEREPMQRRLVRVPDVVGLNLQKALLLIQHAGLKVGAVLYKESYEEKDTILEQKPQRGQMVYASDEVTLWTSRESYIKWLPAIYQRSDATGRNYVRDLLWVIQHLFGSIETMLDTIHLYFDSYETPEHFLPWLAAWSAMLLEPDWPVSKKRRLIKKAMELYRLRGTVRGLKLFISLFTGFEPHLAENEWPFNGFRIGVSSTVGIDTVILPPVDKAHSFVVVMPHKFKDVTSQSIIRLHEIIEMEKPSHSTYMLKFEDPRQAVEEREFYRIGVTSGVNVGQEVVTPLPLDAETGEPEYPKEPVMPPPPPNPSVYELFGTKKRQLPPIVGAAKADNAPVEGREVTSSKYGFEGAREFRLDDIMKELLARAGLEQSVDVSVETGSGTGEASSVVLEELAKTDVGPAQSDEAVLESTLLGQDDVAAKLASPSAASVETVSEESSKTPVTEPASATADEEQNIPRAGLGATVEGGVKGRQPKVDIDVSIEEIGGDEIEEVNADDWIQVAESATDSKPEVKPEVKASSKPESEGVAKVSSTASVEGSVQTGGPRVEIEIEKREVPSDEGQAPSGSDTPSDGSKK